MQRKVLLRTGKRIATTSLRTGLAMTGSFTRGAGECPAGGQSRPPLRKRYKECGASPGGRGRTPPLRRVTSSAEEESPRHGFAVTAPLGKGTKGRRIATTSDIGHWFRNDRGFTRGAVQGRRAGRGVRPYIFVANWKKQGSPGGGGPCFSFFIPFILPRRWPCRLYRSYSSPAWPRSRRGRACSGRARPHPGWLYCG